MGGKKAKASGFSQKKEERKNS